MKVLFVCTGNTCRSPMIKFMFEDYLKRHGIKDTTVDSAGTMKHSKHMTEETVHVLENHGVPHSDNISKFCDKKLLEEADIAICVTKQHAAELKKLYGESRRIVSLFDICSIDLPDPYGNGIVAYEGTFELINSILPEIYQYIQK